MGVVYPHISIKEEESPVYATIEDSQNTVVVPMLYARHGVLNSEGTSIESYDEEPMPVYYDTLSDFTADMATGAGGGSETSISRYVIYSDGSLDRGYLMACTLLEANLPILMVPIIFNQNSVASTTTKHYSAVEGYWCTLVQAAITGTDTFYTTALFDLYSLSSKSLYDFRFVTTGGYHNIGDWSYVDESQTEKPTITITATSYQNMLTLASTRGDCVALLDVSSQVDTKAKLNTIATTKSFTATGMYGALFAPWCVLSNVSQTSTATLMPASLAYLLAYASSIANNASWLAVSGITRGVIPGLVKPLFNITESFMEELQGKVTTVTCRINPIINAGVYGYRIWGNRVIYPSDTTGTLELKYQDFLNVRMLLCLIKKQLYTAALRTTFEPNDAVVWVNFKSLVNDLLEQMRSGRGISWYRWKRLPAGNKATIKAKLYVKPIEAVEMFDITVSLTDDDTVVEEG